MQKHELKASFFKANIKETYFCLLLKTIFH